MLLNWPGDCFALTWRLLTILVNLVNPENENFWKISGWVSHDLPIRVNGSPSENQFDFWNECRIRLSRSRYESSKVLDDFIEDRTFKLWIRARIDFQQERYHEKIIFFNLLMFFTIFFMEAYLLSLNCCHW